MRAQFFKELKIQMEKDKDIIAMTGDLGYGGFDKISSEFSDRFYNCQAAEFSMMGVATGLALDGKKPFVYSIGTFLVYRPFEIIRTYINFENIPVKLVCSGRDYDYAHDGVSHWMHDIKIYLDSFGNIKQYWPESKEEIPSIVEEMANNNLPCFLSLKR